MSKVNLDHLLDNDCLSASQERQVRRLCNYEIKLGESRGYIAFCSLKNNKKDHFSVKAITLQKLKTKYNKLMCRIIQAQCRNIDGIEMVTAVQTVLAKDTKRYQNQNIGILVLFKDSQNFYLPAPQDLNSQTLFKIVEIVFKL